MAAMQQHAMAPAQAPADAALAARTLNLLMRLLGDSVVRQRILADSALHGSMLEVIERMPAEHREHLRMLLHGNGSGAMQTPPARSQPLRKPD
jgi:hypothetical protein